ncbi:GNAT family N-acetyltransferase [Streptomyces sp. NPDC001380]|uniref:GNAT family N-acetyltransferase n=1 Tax=Streptomyces sp. NPDC001380 TaxID=3364566 RepID=UPI0036BEDFEF
MPESPTPAGATAPAAPVPPAGTSVRPVTPDGAEAVQALLNAIDVLETGTARTDLHEVEADLADPGTDLPTGSWLGLRGGRAVCYGLLRDAGGGRLDLDHYTLPDHQDLGFHVLGLMTARAAAAGADRAVLHLLLAAEPTTDTARLAAGGWRRVRRHHVLTRPVSRDTDPVPAPPPGVTLRTCEDEDGRRAAHALLERTFAAHYGHRPRSYEEWREAADTHRQDWSLCWTAAADGLGDAAVLQCRDDRGAAGWVSRLGVVEEARGRGLGGHLLELAFAAFAERGRDTVELGVDTENTTGALRLYEGWRMVLDHAVDTWEAVVPAG